MERICDDYSYVSASFSMLVHGRNVTHTTNDPYKMLLIGETGSGKTSFLNFLWNSELVQELGFETAMDRFGRFNDIKCENPEASKMESKTSKATLYPQVKLADDLVIGIVDTPGFGDSRGMKEDEKHCKAIIDTLKQIDFINCICLIINGTVARMSPSLKYVLTQVSTILPKKVIDNMIIVFTNVSDELDLNFDVHELEPFLGKEIDPKLTFLINNPFCRVEKAKEKQGKIHHTKIAKSLQKAFEEARHMLNEVCTTIKDFLPLYTTEFVVLYKTKQKIERKVMHLLIEFDNQRELEEKIKKAENDVEEALHKKKLHADYTYYETVKTTIQTPTARHNTLCGAPQCYNNCHLSCNLPKSMAKLFFINCWCIKNDGNCRVCGHHYTYHYHDEVKHEVKEDKVLQIKPEGKRKFNQAKTMEERAKALKEDLRRDKEEVEEKKRSLSLELVMTIDKFEQIGLSSSYVAVLKNQRDIIEYRLKSQDRSDYEDLQQALDEINKKISIVEGTKKS